MEYYIIFDIGGTSIKYAVMNKNAHILEKVGFAKVRPKVVRCQFGNAANMVGALYHYISRH